MFTIYNIFHVLYLLVNLLSRDRFKEIGVSFNNKTYKLKYNNKVIEYALKV